MKPYLRIVKDWMVVLPGGFPRRTLDITANLTSADFGVDKNILIEFEKSAKEREGIYKEVDRMLNFNNKD